jgi:hypothetical protein
MACSSEYQTRSKTAISSDVGVIEDKLDKLLISAEKDREEVKDMILALAKR